MMYGVIEKRDTGKSSIPRRQHGSGLSASATALLMSARNSVCPSAGAFAASRAAIRPFAPGRLSTITAWPNASESFAAICRARMSGELPAAAGTRIFMGLVGKLWANAARHHRPRTRDRPQLIFIGAFPE